MPKLFPSRFIGSSPILLPFLLLAAPALAAPVDAAPATMAPTSTAHVPTALGNDASIAADAPAQLHAGYPTTREKWRYCPRDGAHPCVDLDIPGVTVPEPPAMLQR